MDMDNWDSVGGIREVVGISEGTQRGRKIFISAQCILPHH